MRILSIDTTSPWGSVALVRDAEVLGEVRLREETHSQAVFVAIDLLLRMLGLAPLDVDAYAVATGPGSFTGVRVGVSAVQGLALASERPCLGLTSLQGLAAKMRHEAALLVPMVDAYREQVYAAVYDPQLSLRQEPHVADPDVLAAAMPEGAAFLGDGSLRYRERILAACPGALFPERSLFLAAILGCIAAPRLAAGEGFSASELRPFYLRPPTIGKARVVPAAP
jgi:tRNA threonylcarbamoyladenosine biosynthesis protein TsaB